MPGSGLLSRDIVMGETLSSQDEFVSSFIWGCGKEELTDASTLNSLSVCVSLCVVCSSITVCVSVSMCLFLSVLLSV